MLTNTDSTQKIFQAYQHHFPENAPTSDNLNHPLLHDIGQPHKTKMLTLFFAVALNLPQDEIDQLADQAEQSLKTGFNAISRDTDKQKTAISNVLAQKDEWTKRMRLYLRQAGAVKDEEAPLDVLVSEINGRAPTLN